jgi:hypothetical protein
MSKTALTKEEAMKFYIGLIAAHEKDSIKKSKLKSIEE